MPNSIDVPINKWDELGAILEELYGMVHSLNGYLAHDEVDTAKHESNEIEQQVVKALDVYNKIESQRI